MRYSIVITPQNDTYKKVSERLYAALLKHYVLWDNVPDEFEQIDFCFSFGSHKHIITFKYEDDVVLRHSKLSFWCDELNLSGETVVETIEDMYDLCEQSVLEFVKRLI